MIERPYLTVKPAFSAHIPWLKWVWKRLRTGNKSGSELGAQAEQTGGTQEANATVLLLVVAGNLHCVVPTVCLFPQSTSRAGSVVLLPSTRLYRGVPSDTSYLSR